MTQRDPVCGMDIEPQSAFAKREHTGQTFYFCSQSCVDQFDKDPNHFMPTSATTGFNAERTLSRVELPIVDMPIVRPATELESALRALDGVDQVKVNAAAGKIEVQYDAQKVDVSKFVSAIKSVAHKLKSELKIYAALRASSLSKMN